MPAGREVGIIVSWQGGISNQASKTGLQLLGMGALGSVGVPFWLPTADDLWISYPGGKRQILSKPIKLCRATARFKAGISALWVKADLAP